MGYPRATSLLFPSRIREYDWCLQVQKEPATPDHIDAFKPVAEAFGEWHLLAVRSRGNLSSEIDVVEIQ
jgi:hypothetical protein